MELHQLGKQYLQRADILLERIHRLKAESKNLSGTDLILMKRRILSLYTDAANCRKHANWLLNYRKGDTKNEQNNLQP